MKSALTIIISVWFITIVLGQNEIVWSKNFGGSGWDSPWKIELINDQIIVVGFSNSQEFGENFNTYNKAFCLLLDENGELQELNTFAEEENNLLFDIVAAEDGNYLAGGIIQNGLDPINEIPIYDYWIIKLSPKGELIWSKSYGGSKDDWLTRILPIGNNEFILVGNAPSSDGQISNSENGDIWLVKIDADGNIIWDKSFGNDYNSFIEAATILSDGNILLAANLFEPGQSWDINLIKIDPNGEQLWANELGGDNLELTEDVIEAANGDILLTGDSASENSELPKGSFIIRYDSEGNVIWISGFEFDIYQSKINQRSNGTIDVFGTYGSSIEHKTFSGDGLLLNRYIVTENNTNHFSSIKSIPNGYLVSGISSFEEDFPTSIWIFKLIDPTLSNTNHDFAQFDIFPNPASNKIQINSQDKSFNKIEILNQLGQNLETYELKSESHTFHLDLSSYENGIYFLKIQSGINFKIKTVIKI